MVPVQVVACVQLFSTPWTVALQAPLSMGFPRQEYWSGLLFPPPKYILTQGLNRGLLHWQKDSLLLYHLGSPSKWPDVSCCCSVTKSCLTLCNPMDCSRLGFPVPHHLPEFAQVDLRYLPKRFIPLKYNNNYNKISCYVTHLFTIFKVYCLEMDIGLISIVIPSGVFLHQVLKYDEHIIVQRSLLLLHGWSFFWSLNYFGSFYRCLPCILYCRI